MSDMIQVLLLDDEPIVGKRLGPALAKIGCEVEVFQDPIAALTRLKKKSFDIVVTDIRMDEMDGMDVHGPTPTDTDKVDVVDKVIMLP